MKKLLLSLLVVGLVGNAGSAMALSRSERITQLEQRLEKLERQLQAQGLVEMQIEIQRLQQEIQALRGEVEQLRHENQQLREHQRDLYQDLDRRMLNMERGGGGNGTEQGQQADEVDAAEQAAYQKAFNLLKEFRYEEAVVAFGEYLKQYPNGRYAHLAMYWRGEANFMQQKYKLAIADYQNLIDNHPDSYKKPEAMLKIGYCHKELKDYAAARKQLQQLVKDFPESNEASQARKLLDEIKKQGK
jgi:tol-pal system protein YbgF